MNVFRLWWALTRLVLTGRGGYEAAVVLASNERSAGYPRERYDPVIRQVERTAWHPAYVDWHDGQDRCAVITVEPEDEDYHLKPVRPAGDDGWLQ